ncbi:hypothetical protein [Larkinella sp.]|uniref:hypothetical protein n=1 Tax=Larkinella sp. TaxID=2034517 RepID=UPI003BA9B86B
MSQSLPLLRNGRNTPVNPGGLQDVFAQMPFCLKESIRIAPKSKRIANRQKLLLYNIGDPTGVNHPTFP